VFCERDLWRAWSPGGLPGSRDADGPIYSAAGANRPPEALAKCLRNGTRGGPQGDASRLGQRLPSQVQPNAARYHPSLDHRMTRRCSGPPRVSVMSGRIGSWAS